ncbi:VOC family protein [Cereibacter sphaeroides]|nr:VOC family protein [Cereibacter sphaeroides]
MSQANTLPRQAPIHVGTVGLKVLDAERMSRYYQDAVGLAEIERDGATIWLGAGGERLLALTQQDDLAIAPPREAGLYHTAFLLPSRADLARWIGMASMNRLPVDGASNHGVSEAIYLSDPEGNGIEIYADTPQNSWHWEDGQVAMGSTRLDVPAIMDSVGGMPLPWTGAPSGTMVGHVHLKVGDAAQAGRWWVDTMGFDSVRQRDGAVFLSTGGYHHHIAVNEWQSQGVGRRGEGRTGLDFVELRRATPGPQAEHQDDWGTVIRLV